MNTKEAFEDPRIVMLEEIILDEYEHGKQVEDKGSSHCPLQQDESHPRGHDETL